MRLNWRNPHVVIGAIVALLFLSGVFTLVRMATSETTTATGDVPAAESSLTAPSNGVGPGSDAPDGAAPTSSAEPPSGVQPSPGDQSSSGTETGAATGTASGDGPTSRAGGETKPSVPPKRAVIRAGGVTLDNKYPVSSFDELVNPADPEQRVSLGEVVRCALLINDTGIALTVKSISAAVDAGTISTETECENSSVDGFDLPAGAPECSEGAEVASGAGCWVGLRMVTLPSSPSQGTLSLSLAGTCTSTTPPACAAAESSNPSAENPVDVINTQTYSFKIEAATADAGASAGS